MRKNKVGELLLLDRGLTQFMAIRQGKVEIVAYSIFSGSKITVVGDDSHEIKRRLLLGKKAMTNLDSILKSILLCQ